MRRAAFAAVAVLAGTLVVVSTGTAQRADAPTCTQETAVVAGEGVVQTAARIGVPTGVLKACNPWLFDIVLDPGDILRHPVPVDPPTTEAPTTTAAPTTTEAPTTTTTEPPATEGFVETFDTAASLDQFVFEIADGRSWPGDGRTFAADHAITPTGCGSPLTSRQLSTPDLGNYRLPFRLDDATVRASNLAYWCPVGTGHFMTALDTGGYAHFDFRPDRTFTDVGEVCWDQNVTDMGSGRWWEVAVVPLDTFNANGQRMDYTHPSRNGSGQPGGWGLPISDGVWKGKWEDRPDSSLNQQTIAGNIVHQSTNDKVARTTHCVTRDGGSVTMTADTIDGQTVSQTFPHALPTGEVVVIFSDVLYNPTKRAGWDAGEFTTHWDNITISEG